MSEDAITYIATAATKGSAYMLLWAPLPDPTPDADETPGPLKWRELGWVKAHDPEQAKTAGVESIRTRHEQAGAEHPQRAAFEKALTGHGLKLRAIARRGWLDEDQIGETRLVSNPQLQIG
jgi:hypothetical protein